MTQTQKEAWCHRLVVAGPSDMDLYATHQAVWDVVSKRCITSNPQLIYRVDNCGDGKGGLIHVRVVGAALEGSRAMRTTFAVGQRLTASCRIAPWRSVRQLQHASAEVLQDRVRDIFANAGLELPQHDGLNILQTGVQTGRKCKLGVDIQLPYVDCLAQLVVTDASLAARAWNTGIGRGRRFGFGMLCLV